MGMCWSTYYHYLLVPHTFFCLGSGSVAAVTFFLLMQEAIMKSLICASAHLDEGGENVRFTLQNGRQFQCKVKDINLKKFNSKDINLTVMTESSSMRLDVCIPLTDKGSCVDH